MVEDEFYAVAQTFTQHLHHAEYLRRIKQAKLENANAINDIARPTDGKTIMREEKKRQKESEALSAQQRAGLSGMKAKRPRVESEEGDTDTDVDQEDDPWFGTSLHRLMTSPRQTRSLVGLEVIKSSTRAAAGYRQLPKPKSGSGSFQSVQEPQKGPSLTTLDETASEDDDLELAPTGIIKTSPSSQKRFHKKRASSGVVIKSIDALKEPHETENSHDSSGPETKKGIPKYSSSSTSNFSSKMKLLLDELDDFDGSPKTKEMKIKDERSYNQKMPEKKKSRLNEVPTFLV
jgi:hypothetical protein